MPRLDLTVLAIPGFFGAMGAEYAWQRRHPAAPGETRPGDYELNDTIASLAMGVGSLLAPFVAKRVLDPLKPGTGPWHGNVVAGPTRPRGTRRFTLTGLGREQVAVYPGGAGARADHDDSRSSLMTSSPGLSRRSGPRPEF